MHTHTEMLKVDFVVFQKHNVNGGWLVCGWVCGYLRCRLCTNTYLQVHTHPHTQNVMFGIQGKIKTVQTSARYVFWFTSSFLIFTQYLLKQSHTSWDAHTQKLHNMTYKLFIFFPERGIIIFQNFNFKKNSYTQCKPMQTVWHILKFLCYSCYNSGAQELSFQQTGIFSAAESWWPVRELKRTSGLQAEWLWFSKDTFICRYRHGNSVRIIWLGLSSDHEWLHADVYSKEPAALYKHPTRSTFVSI